MHSYATYTNYVKISTSILTVPERQLVESDASIKSYVSNILDIIIKRAVLILKSFVNQIYMYQIGV